MQQVTQSPCWCWPNNSSKPSPRPGLIHAFGCTGWYRTDMKKIKPFWRVLVALLADAIFVLYIGYHAARTNSHYFRITASSLTPGNILAGLVVVYLSVVAISGRWWPFKRGD